MGMFSAVIDRSPIDKFGTQGNAAALANYAATNMARSQELYDMNSSRNQMFQQKSMEQAFDVQAQQGMMAQRQAARSGQAFTPQGMDTSAQIQSQVQAQQAQMLMGQQGLAGKLSGQAGNMQGQAGQLKNTLNDLYRQQQAANQQARIQANAAKLSMASAAFGAVAGPAMGAIGSKIGQSVGGMMGMTQQVGTQAGGWIPTPKGK